MNVMNETIQAAKIILGFGMIWGLFPIIESISWEGQVSGAIAGLFLAFWFFLYFLYQEAGNI